MVLIVHKRSESDQFLVEAPSSIFNEELIEMLVKISNARVLLTLLSNELEKLANYGREGEEEHRKAVQLVDEEMYYDDEEQEGNTKKEEKLSKLDDNIATTLTNTIAEVRVFLSKVQVDNKIFMTYPMVVEKINLVKASMIIAFPSQEGVQVDVSVLISQLPEGYHITNLLKQDPNALKKVKYIYDTQNCTLWWANKELTRGEKLSKFIGTNDKTKVIVKLQKGSHPPTRDTTESEQQKAMMAYYWKKQQEQKKLEEDNEDDYLNSPWANPKGLKNQFNGLTNITWKPH